jgi:hypothetical protein
MENQEDSKNKNDNNKKRKHFTDVDTNAVNSITDLWQQYSPMAWTEMYNEYIKYTVRMTEIYQEYAKSSERMTELYKESAKSTEKMTKYWLNYFSWMKPLSENKEKKEKQEQEKTRKNER